MTSFDDIKYWIGSGENRAAIVIDWVEDNDDPPALAWGYRWDGTATGRDMLLAVLTADARLYAKLGSSLANPTAVYGIGYDANDDGLFALDDNTSFNAAGIAITGPADLTISVDPNDYYAEGWFSGFWHYGVSTGNPYDGGSWSSSQTGMTGRALIDGAWDSWAYTPSFDFTAFATNPIAALPPGGLRGDYNDDGVVDALDYQTWVSAFGQTGPNGADGNCDGVVNAADYVVWRDRLGATSLAASYNTIGVPEPKALTLTGFCFIGMFLAYLRSRKQCSSARRHALFLSLWRCI